MRKVLKKYNLTPQNKQQVILFSKGKATLLSAINIFVRIIEFKKSVVDQKQNQLH